MAFSLCVSFASLFSLLEGSANNFLTPVKVLLLLVLSPSSFLLVVFYCRYWVKIHRKPDLKHPPLAFFTTSHCSTWIRAELFSWDLMRIELGCCEGPVLPCKEHDNINVAKPPSPKCWILELQKADYEAPYAGEQPRTCCFTFSSSSWAAWAVLYLEAAPCACKANSRSEPCQHETSPLCFVRVCWMSLRHVLMRKTSALLSAKPARINPGIRWNAFLRLGSKKAGNFSPQPSVSVRDWKLTIFKGPINLKTQARTCAVWRDIWHWVLKKSILFSSSQGCPLLQWCF